MGLDEYVSVGDAAEALMRIKELGAPNSFLPKVVEMIVEKILDNAKPREKELLTKLALATVQRGALTLDMFLEGYKTHSDQLEDSMLDIPLAPTLLGDFFCTSVSDKVLDFSHLAGICEKIEGGEPRRALVGAILALPLPQGRGLRHGGVQGGEAPARRAPQARRPGPPGPAHHRGFPQGIEPGEPPLGLLISIPPGLLYVSHISTAARARARFIRK